MLALALTLFAAAPTDGVPEAARAKYQEAVAKLTAQQYGPANDVLNALAAQHPRVAEIFASRCSAQLGLQHWAAAEADCAYSLKLKPLPTALYGLAVAEDGQGRFPLAITHYQQYAALPEATAQLKAAATARAELLMRQTNAVAPAPPPPPSNNTPAVIVKPVEAVRPPPGGGKGQFVPGIPDANEGLLYVYRSITPAPATGVTLYVDNARIGDLWNERYFEVRLKAGKHDVKIRGADTDTVLTVEVDEAEISYLKLQLAEPGFKLVAVGKEGRKEIREMCELVYSKRL